MGGASTGPEMEAYSYDYGRMTRRAPGAVARPGSVEETCRVVRDAARAGIRVAVRGGGHSQGGQSLADGGLLLDTRGLDAIRPAGPEVVRAQGGAEWGKVIAALRGTGRLPSVLVDIGEATVGGTLSAGGVGSTSHRHGAQVGQVERLEVVTGTGERLLCSPTLNSGLFGRRAGRPGPVRDHHRGVDSPSSGGGSASASTSSATSTTAGSRTTSNLSRGRIDSTTLGPRSVITNGEIVPLRRLRVRRADDPDDDARLDGLRYEENTYTRETTSVGMGRGLPQVGLQLAALPPLAGLDPTVGSPGDAARRAASGDGVGAAPALELDRALRARRGAGSGAALHASAGGGWRSATRSWPCSASSSATRPGELANRLREVDRTLVALGGKGYLSGDVGYGPDEWAEHYGETLERAVSWRREFDPKGSLRPKGDALCLKRAGTPPEGSAILKRGHPCGPGLGGAAAAHASPGLRASRGATGCLLVSESWGTLLRGRLPCDLAPLLDGRRTHREIAARLAPIALRRSGEGRDRLPGVRGGYVVSGDHEMPSERAAYWSSLGASPRWAEKLLGEVDGGGDGWVATCSLASSWRWAFGLRETSPIGAIAGPATCGPSYRPTTSTPGTEPSTASISRAASPWSSSSGREAFSPSRGRSFAPRRAAPCWECVAYRLRGHRELHNFLRNIGAAGAGPRAFEPAEIEAVCSVAAAEIARWLVLGDLATLHEHAVSWDIVSRETGRHLAARRPQCRACGDEGSLPARSPGRARASAVQPEADPEQRRRPLRPARGDAGPLSPLGQPGHRRRHLARARLGRRGPVAASLVVRQQPSSSEPHAQLAPAQSAEQERGQGQHAPAGAGQRPLRGGRALLGRISRRRDPPPQAPLRLRQGRRVGGDPPQRRAALQRPPVGPRGRDQRPRPSLQLRPRPARPRRRDRVVARLVADRAAAPASCPRRSSTQCATTRVRAPPSGPTRTGAPPGTLSRRRPCRASTSSSSATPSPSGGTTGWASRRWTWGGFGDDYLASAREYYGRVGRDAWVLDATGDLRHSGIRGGLAKDRRKDGGHPLRGRCAHRPPG